MSELVKTEWFLWGIGLILGFQILVVLVGELLYRADRRALPIAPILRAARNTVLPLLVAYLFAVKVLDVPAESTSVRIIATSLWISVLYAALLLMNALVFQQAPEGTWRHNAPSLFQELLRMLLVTIGAAIVLALVWGQDLGGLVAALGVGSIVLGLALQETLGNLMSGIALLFEKPFTIGDWISVGDEQGEVVEVNWRSVHLRTRERNLLVFPNSALGREAVINYARPTKLQTLRLSFAFSLDDPPNQVKQVLVDVAREMDWVLDNPPPSGLVREVQDDRIRYEAFLFIDQPRLIPQIVDDYTTKVWYAMQRSGIRMPLPAAYEINVSTRTQTLPGLDVKSTLDTAVGFQVLAAAELADLLDSAVGQQFARGERIVAAGTIADAIYVIESGQVRIYREQNDAVLAKLILLPGEIVGLTSLTQQQPSKNQTICDTDVRVVKLPRTVVEQLVRNNTRFAQELASVQSTRTDSMQRSEAEWLTAHSSDEELLPVSMRRPQSEPDEAES